VPGNGEAAVAELPMSGLPPEADIELAFTRLSLPCTHRDRPPRAHQLERVDDFLSVRVHVDRPGVSKFVLIPCRNRIAEHQRVDGEVGGLIAQALSISVPAKVCTRSRQISRLEFPSNINSCLMELKFGLFIIQWAKYLRPVINEPLHSLVGNHRLAIQLAYVANID